MPHLGTQPPVGFKTTTKQSFSGDNSTTAFTLNRASSTATDLEIFVDNIQQEPTTAYSVSGTTLTFTEAPPTGTNNVYVVNRGGDQNGTLPPQDLGTTDYIFGDDISFNSDSAKLNFGADSEITITHVADTGLNFKHTATGDDKPIILTLQTGETDIAANDVLGTINFQAPDEGTGTDAILVAAGIEAVSEGDFSSSSNATKLSFKTASSAAASETMSLSSAGLLTIADDLVIGDNKTIGSASSPSAITIQSDGLVQISRSDNLENLSLISTDADASVGPTLRMDRQSASAADGDLLGKINFVGHNDADEDIGYAGITAIINDASDSTEDGKLAINTIVAGTERSRVFIDASETVLNEDSIDLDFRVESNGLTNAFMVDGGNNGIGFGHSPRSDLHTAWTQSFFGIEGSLISQRDSGGGIAGMSITQNVYVDSDTGGYAYMTTNEATKLDLKDGILALSRAASGTAGNAISFTEVLRTDASANLLIGHTSQDTPVDNGGAGVTLRPGGIMLIGGTGTSIFANREDSDGEIIQFRKDGSTVGSIGCADLSSASRVFIGNSNCNLLFNDAVPEIVPANSNGSKRDDAIDLGNATGRFDDIRATNGTIQTSDKNEKNTIVDSDLGIDFVNSLSPKSYKFNNKTRTHYGLIAQDVETVLGDIKKDASQFAGFCKDDISEKQDGSEYRYGLRYHEFISPMIQAIKDLKAEVDTLKTKVTALEGG